MTHSVPNYRVTTWLLVPPSVKSPDDRIVIRWLHDATHGTGFMNCAAWQGQFEIDRLIRDGYTIVSLEGV